MKNVDKMSPQEETNQPDSLGTNKDDGIYEPKEKPKIIRILTVTAYVLSVSMAAILLSTYYVFMWDGQPHLGARRSNLEPQRLVDGPRRVVEEKNTQNLMIMKNNINRIPDQPVDVLSHENIIDYSAENFFTHTFNLQESIATSGNMITEKMEIQSQIFPVYEDFTTASSTTSSTEDSSTLSDYSFNSELFNYSKKSTFMKKLTREYNIDK